MAATASETLPNFSSDFSQQPSIRLPNFTSVNALSESGLTSIPSSFASSNNFEDLPVINPPEGTLPIIDFSLLTSINPQQRSKAIQDLGKACEEWTFFMLINHGIPESLMNRMIEGVTEFFNLPDQEKKEFQREDFYYPIRWGSSFNSAAEEMNCWRDFLKVFVHPEFHFPPKPAGLSDAAFEYMKSIREITRELLRGVSESLGLEPNYISKAVNLESSLQIFVANLYPPCPQPELAMGLLPHTDYSLMTLIMDNGISGLDILHHGKWVKVHAPPNALMVITANQLEILTNGKYKSSVHRAALYGKTKRVSLATGNGPSLDKVIRPAPEFVNESHPPGYRAVKYKEFFEMHQRMGINGKSALDCVRIQN